MKRSGGFTLVEAVVLLAVVSVMAVLVVAAMPKGRRAIICGRHGSQLGGIHKGLVLYAQTINGYYPGFDAEGNDLDTSVEGRLLLLLKGEYFAGNYPISPQESLAKTPWMPGTTSVTTTNYSYALLQLPATGERRSEWRDTVNGKAPIASDRAMTDDRGGIHSLHAKARPGKVYWKGQVVWNDNHVTWETTFTRPTQYGASSHKADDLFKAAGTDDAYMIYEGR